MRKFLKTKNDNERIMRAIAFSYLEDVNIFHSRTLTLLIFCPQVESSRLVIFPAKELDRPVPV